jgi:hypothetical protein
VVRVAPVASPGAPTPNGDHSASRADDLGTGLGTVDVATFVGLATTTPPTTTVTGCG